MEGEGPLAGQRLREGGKAYHPCRGRSLPHVGLVRSLEAIPRCLQVSTKPKLVLHLLVHGNGLR